MKKVKGKYIRLTEDELKQIIKEVVDNKISLIMEYAEPRKEFIKRVIGLGKQIIQNWCLIHCCTVTNEDVNRCKNHWKEELSSAIENIADISIKGNDSFETRKKAIVEAFNELDLNQGISKIEKYTRIKFQKEGISNKDIKLQVINDCFNNLGNIIDVLAKGYDENWLEYIETI